MFHPCRRQSAGFVLAVRHSIRALLLCLLVATANQTAFGQSSFGNALSFNGTTQGVIVPNFGNIIPTNEITVEFWANCTKVAGQGVFGLIPDQFTNRFDGIVNYNSLGGAGATYWDFGNINTSGRIGPVPAPANSLNNWVHYALVASQSGNFMSLYTNGVLQVTKAGMTPFLRGNYDLQLGGPTALYNGSLDDFRVWSVALSPSQIQTNYDTPLLGNEPNLLVYYKFDSSSGTVATNSAIATGPAYNGILTNNPVWIASTIPSPPAFGASSAVVVGANPANGARTVRFTVAVNPNGAQSFLSIQYGLTTAYAGTNGPVNVPAGFNATNVTVTVPGFSAGWTFHWNAMGTNINGSASGPDQTFLVPAPGGSGIPGDINGDGVVSQSEFDTVYGFYATNSPWLGLTNVAGPGGTNVTFALSNSNLDTYTILYSTNLTDWQALGPAVPRYLFTDTNAPAGPLRYYRLVYP